MRKLRVWGLTAALVAGLATAAAQAGDDPEDATEAKPAPKQSSFRWSPGFAKMMGLDQKKPEPKKTPPKKKAEAKKPDPPSKPATVVDEAAAERAREEANLIRRLQVSDRLKEVALKYSDNELLRQAEALDERARTAYAQRTAYLRGVHAGSEADEKTLDKYLGPRSAATMQPSENQSYTVPSNAQAAVKEVNQ
jgi:hypothetical protein